MAAAFTTDQLLTAFDAIGRAALDHGQRLDFAVYGGSALMLASNFRFASEDVDIAPLEKWPDWLADVVAEIRDANGWSADWLNDAVGFHLSARAKADDHMLFGSFPADAASAGLRVFVPTAEYMLALKLKAMRIFDPVKGERERSDVLALMTVCGVSDAAGAEAVLARYFPVSAAAPEKLRFLLKHLLSQGHDPHDAPRYPVASR